MVGIYVISMLSFYSNTHFLNETGNFLSKYTKMFVINPTRKTSGNSKNLLTYYMRGRFTGGNSGTTVLEGSPVEYMFHLCELAKAVALRNLHVTTTANSITRSLWINLILLLFSTDYSWICVLVLHSAICLLCCPAASAPYHSPSFPALSLLLFNSSAPQTAEHIPFQTSYLCSWSYQWRGSDDAWSFWINLCQKEWAKLKGESVVSHCTVGRHQPHEPVLLFRKASWGDSYIVKKLHH